VELDFAGCVARARSLGKPVIVFLAPPESERATWDPRDEFADFLTSGDDGLWRDLALCELACASAEEIRATIPTSRLEPSTLLVVIEHGPSGPEVSVIVSEPVAEHRHFFGERDEWLHEQRVRFAGWTSAVHGSIAAVPESLQRRADQARGALGAGVCARVEECLRSAANPDAELLGCAAALFLQAAAEKPTPCARFQTLVVESTRTRVLARGFSGAGWGLSLGCGASKEENPRPRKNPAADIETDGVGYPCGIARVDKFSNRFLWFYTDSDR